jgi:hypothetical protein
MPFQVEELSLELVDALAPLMPRIKDLGGHSKSAARARRSRHGEPWLKPLRAAMLTCQSPRIRGNLS